MIQRTTLIFIIALIVFLAVIILVISFVTGRTLKPLKLTEASVKAIAQGDLTNEIQTKSKDEIGAISRNVNKIIQNLRGLIGNVVNVS